MHGYIINNICNWISSDFCKNKHPKWQSHLGCSWWRRVDSNHRSRRQQIYSLPPLATRELLHIYILLQAILISKARPPQNQLGGAGGRTRTPDLLITNQLLYQLSYTSIPIYDVAHSIRIPFVCQQKISIFLLRPTLAGFEKIFPIFFFAAQNTPFSQVLCLLFFTITIYMKNSCLFAQNLSITR